MSRRTRFVAVTVMTAASMTAAACGKDRSAATSGGDVAPAASAPSTYSGPATATASEPTADTMTRKHHSKLGGAVVGAAAGHMLGGHAIAGAVVGAMVQHERNKHGH